MAVPLCTTHPDQELRYVVENSEAMILLASEKFREKALDVVREGVVQKPIVAVEKIEEGKKSGESITLEDPRSGEGGIMLYTSGTTSRPVCLQRTSLTRWKGELRTNI
jgi:acyl-coenzyme A synthetase/AMP-(fatty) acid ligase